MRPFALSGLLAASCALLACGGDPFTVGEAMPELRLPEASAGPEAAPGADAAPEADPDPETGAPDGHGDSRGDERADGGSAPEATTEAGDSGSVEDGGQDSGQDSAVVESGLQDTWMAPETGLTDTWTAPETGVTCPNVLGPGEYAFLSMQSGGAIYSSPAACATCSTYTCACVLANDSRLGAGCTCSVGSNYALDVVCP